MLKPTAVVLLVLISLPAEARFGDRLRRRANPTPAGTPTSQNVLIAPSCLSDASNPQARMAGFDRAIEEAKTRINGCQARYPDLAPYFENWKRSLSGLSIECVRNAPHDNPSDRGIQIEQSYAWFLQQNAADYPIGYEKTIKQMVHKIFHVSGADNQSSNSDHSSRMREDYDTYGLTPRGANPRRPMYGKFAPFCLQDYTTDRVEVLTQLCTGFDLGTQSSEFAAIQLLLSQRMSECPRSSCTQLMTSQTVSLAAAQRACARIDQVGECYQRKFCGGNEPRNCESTETRDPLVVLNECENETPVVR